MRLGQGSLWDNSEPTYGEIVKELFRTRDWLTLHYDYGPWFVHPPLWFWITGGSVAALGLNEFALRLPSALFGVLCAAAVYRAAERMYGPLAGPFAALALGTSLEFIVLGRLAILDTALVFFSAVAIFWGYFALTHGDRRAFWIAVICAALGTVIKGPVALVIPVLVLGVYAVWTRSWRLVFDLPLLRGALLYVVIAGAWFAFQAHAHGVAFLTEYFLRSNVGRALEPFENQPGPWWYYLPVLLVGFFPYVAFVPWGLWSAVRARGSDERLLLSAIGMPLIIYSAAQTKLPNYIGVIFPALAVLIGGCFAKAAARERALPVAVGMGVVAALTAALVAFAGTAPLAHTPYVRFSPELQALTVLMAACAIAGLAAFLIARRAWIVPAALALMMLAFVAYSTATILPRVEAFKPMKAMAATVMSHWHNGNRLGVYGLHGEYSLLFYTSDGPMAFVGDAPGDTPPGQFFNRRAHLLVVVAPQKFAELAPRHPELRVLDREPTMLLVTNE